ncbi:MAG: polyprenyl synthetase family protein [Helicobacter sp.]|nr:polyprenyl synthetase family protein [Helicobacter sp.]
MEALEQIKETIQGFLRDLKSPLVLEISKDLQSGKMLRSKLILSIAGINQDSILLCAIIEMIQNASLLHDDVIDNANMRRCKPSINAMQGNKNAIMLGDLFYSKAFCVLTTLAKKYPEIPSIVSESVVQLSLGEMEDVHLSKAFNDDKKKYLAMVEKKTASLIEASALGAALLAKKNNQNAQKFKIYGKNLGIAFQIIDDILDITADNDQLGKPALSDFKEGKTTLPYIYLYSYLQEADKECLKSLFKKELSSKESAWILEKIQESEAIAKSFQDAKNFAQSGIAAIKDQKCDKLVAIMQEMINRKF